MMDLAAQNVVLHLSDEGRRVLQQVGVPMPEAAAVWFEVEEVQEQGIWVRFEFDDGQHLLLVLWKYVVALDVPKAVRQSAGQVN
jgi:hypothetical protein